MADRGFIIDDREVAMPAYSAVCTGCRRLKDTLAHRCEAFAEIPEAIWLGQNKHTQPFPGDNGLRFEPLPPEGGGK